MIKHFDLSDPIECNELNRLLIRYGVHIERDLFDHPYIIMDYDTFFAAEEHCGRPRKISQEVREQVLNMKAQGCSVRYIAARFNISIGAVSSIKKT